jgi:hypothetical protein
MCGLSLMSLLGPKAEIELPLHEVCFVPQTRTLRYEVGMSRSAKRGHCQLFDHLVSVVKPVFVARVLT